MFSTYIDEETGEEKLFSTTEFISEEAYLEQHQFGVASKVGAVLSPGGWNAKELAKLRSEDEDDYKHGKHRFREYIKGSFAPGTATYKLHQAQKLAKDGASAKEIDEKVGKVKKRHAAAEVGASVLTGGLSSTVTGLAAIGKGAQTKLDEDKPGMRKKFDKNKKK